MTAFQSALRLLCVLQLGLLAGCASDLPPRAPASEASLNASDYRLGPGDRVRIEVFGEEALTTEYTVSTAGDISFPLIGSVLAAGLTVDEMREALTDRLADGYLNNPRVSAEILEYRPFYILGEVAQPGAYPFTDGLTVAQAVALAGGFTYRAQQDKVVIKRATSDRGYTYDLGGNYRVMPGDTIRVPERFF